MQNYMINTRYSDLTINVHGGTYKVCTSPNMKHLEISFNTFSNWLLEEKLSEKAFKEKLVPSRSPAAYKPPLI